ncbi:MAG: hypothetical protein GXO69_02310 [Acidobacteria bacterium]|nr:hypothetical protein [Acidobacteriota bacterium]
MEQAPRFAVDIMLGKLAKWLRLMGFDTFYSNSAGDSFLTALATGEKRILLTRDRPLAAKMGNSAYFVHNILLPGQLAEIRAAFHLYLFHPRTRCSICNGILLSISKSEVAKKVPPYVFQTQKNFLQCSRCGKIYWNGTHIQHIKKTISEMIRTDDNTIISQDKENE